jgi:hypothetical protein
VEDKLDEVLEHKVKTINSDDDDHTYDSDSDQFKGVSALGDSVMRLWKDCAMILKSDFAIWGWYLCVC